MQPIRITTREQLLAVADRLGVSADWHENDQHAVTASVNGMSFDSAGDWPMEEVTFTGHAQSLAHAGIPTAMPTPPHAEIYVTLHQNGERIAQINLAVLFGLACGYNPGDVVLGDFHSGLPTDELSSRREAPALAPGHPHPETL